MLENQFYPTPKWIIEKMVKPYTRCTYRGNTLKYKGFILEPSAGSGAILDHLKELAVKNNHLFAAEIDPDLRYTLQGKNYNVIASNFFEYDEPCKYGFIIMNPPFGAGVKHVLKAWNCLDDDGDLVTLLNAESINNLCIKEREILAHLIEKHGSTEDLGQCFKSSERPTDVHVVMIRLKKPRTESSYSFSGLNLELDQLNCEEFAANPLAHNNPLKNLVARYNTARQVLIERHEMQSKLDFYLDGISSPTYQSTGYDQKESLKQEATISEQLLSLKSRFWNTVFVKTKLGSKCTSDFQNKFTSFAASQSAMAFTEQNVQEVLAMFFLNREQIMQDCLVKVFDEATAYHEKNKIHKEGWKTNKSYKLNKRIILPHGVEFSFCEFSSCYILTLSLLEKGRFYRTHILYILREQIQLNS